MPDDSGLEAQLARIDSRYFGLLRSMKNIPIMGAKECLEDWHGAVRDWEAEREKAIKEFENSLRS